MITILQIILTTLACAGLWRLWSGMAGRGKASLIIGIGFLLRAVGGQLLFWISWLRLPIARSLQLGNGLWFFAIDGPGHLSYADELIGRGVAATVFLTAAYPSHAFIQIFTACAALFGTVASMAILLNCAAFLGTCAIIEWIGGQHPRMEIPRLVALAAIAFGPGTILWSLQPLKDTLFLFLITAMIAACHRWQTLWREHGQTRWRQLSACAAAMLVLIYVIAGFRWYFAGIACLVCIVFFILVALPARRRWSALAASVILLVLLTQAFRVGGDDDVPLWARRFIDPRPMITKRWRPINMQRYVVATRYGFDTTPGATTITPGPAFGPRPEVKKPIAPVVPRKAKRGAAGARSSSTPRLSTPSLPAPLPALPAPRLAETLIAGSSAMFLPRTIGQALGLIRIGGGRGFWLFVELDTIVFDAVLLFAAVYCIGALRSRARVTPLFVFVLFVLVLTAGPMIYTVSNFGTLFRLRQMVYALFAILPLTLAPREAELHPSGVSPARNDRSGSSTS